MVEVAGRSSDLLLAKSARCTLAYAELSGCFAEASIGASKGGAT